MTCIRIWISLPDNDGHGRSLQVLQQAVATWMQQAVAAWTWICIQSLVQVLHRTQGLHQTQGLPSLLLLHARAIWRGSYM